MGYVNYERRKNLGIVTFSKPESLNALSRENIAEALCFFQGLEQRFGSADVPEVRALILTGMGKAFISGADIKEMSAMDPGEAQCLSAQGNSLIRCIETLSLPVIAAVNGYALGGGLELALAADFIWASSGARLGLPELTLGLIPGFGGVRRLCARVGMAKAKELIYTGRIIDAQEAYALGLVNRLFGPEGFLEQVQEAAKSMTMAGPLALRAAKCHAEACLLLDPADAAALEGERFGSLFRADEPREGLRAMIERRPPSWARESQ